MYPRYFPSFCKATQAFEMAKFLIENGAKIDEETVSDETPLIHAITEDNLDVVKLLVSHGANVNRVRHSGSTPLHYATQSYPRNTEIIKVLIDNGADVNATHKYLKITPLHCVASSGYRSSKAARLLLECGADPELRNISGFTPLDFAIRYGNDQIVKTFLEFNTTFVAEMSPTRIQYALDKKKISTFKMIITHCHKYIHQ